MKTNFYKFIIIVFLILTQVSLGQNHFKKVVKVPPPPNKNKLVTEQQNKSENIAQRLKEIIQKKGLLKNQNNKRPQLLIQIINYLIKKLLSLNFNSNLLNKEVVYDKESGMPIFLKTNSRLNKQQGPASNGELINNAKSFLLKEKDLIRIKDPDSEFALKSQIKDNLQLTHLKFTQKYKGLEVWGKEVVLHLDNNGRVISLNGRFVPTPSNISSIEENISSEKAIDIAFSNSGIPEEKLSQKIKSILDYQGPVAKKIIWCDQLQIPHLAWFVEVRKGLSQDWYYFIDAVNGGILNYYNNICYDGATTGTGTDLNGVNRSFGTYQIGDKYYMIDASQPMFDAANSQLPDNPVGALVVVDIDNKDLSSENPIYFQTTTDNNWTDPVAVSAHYNGTLTYKFYGDNFSRNSIDDKGMTIYSIIHVTENSQPMENAFWSGKFMCYGDGASAFKPLAGAYDVTAHEMTHGVTQYSAALEYQGQSGALNESMSDVIGVTADANNWTVGEMIVKDLNLFPTGALRDMADPHNGGSSINDACWQPANMNEFTNTTEDNGGVHINSGIPNHVFYLAATSIGRSDASKIWYRALTVYLTRNSQFIDARIATINAAADLYGASSNQVNAVKNAWDAVGVIEGSGTPPPPPSSIDGDNWILMVNTDSNDPNSLYMAKTQIASNNDFFPLSTTPIGNRPAVSDGSGVIIFVDQDNNLRVLSADPNNPAEEVLDNQGVWWSVAIGPGLSSLALTSIYADTTIYYYDFVNNLSATFKIVTQSYDGPDARTALYADALSFDPTGRYLLFDSYNEIKNANGDTLSFWTINMLDVSNGQMGTVFPPMAEGIDIGNPSFSKTSSIHFTFDYVDENAGEDYVMAADFNSGDAGNVAGPLNVIGFPTYSGDDKTIAYHATGYDQSNNLWDIVNQMPLKDNMIEGTGNSQDYVIGATFPFWFVIGTRTTDIKEETDGIPSSYFLSQNYPNPFNPTTRIQYEIPNLETHGNTYLQLKVYDVLGKEVATLVNEEKPSGTYEIDFNASSLPSGVYFYQLKTGEFIQTRKMILIK